MSTLAFTPMPSLTSRHIAVVATVVAAHAGLLWLLQAGLQSCPPQDVVIPAEILAEWIAPAPPAPAQPVAAPPPLPQPPRAAPQPTVPRPPTPRPAPTPTPAPPAQPVSPATEPAEQMDSAPAAAATPPSAAAVATAPAHASTATVASALPVPPPPPLIELPSATASYLNNPPPRYPPLSRRLGEQGKVVLRVRIEVDGTASQAEVRTSSGFSRLDQTAVQTVLGWRYVPGTRNGVPDAMWFNIPINFVLE